ncbi:hypothetical protein [Streptomyces sp. NPDC008150]|uniref:hypothetical protein n=1 Tax=Streptomyces sp. NPDC008150 TaxID=3364816 RepID=UPI0036EE5420
MAGTEEETVAVADDALYVLTAVLLTPAQFPSVLGDDYPEACAALGLGPLADGYGLVIGQDGDGARWTVVIDDVSLVAVAIASWDCGMEYDLSPDERSVVVALPGWPLPVAVAAPNVPAPHDPDPDVADGPLLSPPDTSTWGPAQRRLGADEIALQWAVWRERVDDSDFITPETVPAPAPAPAPAPEPGPAAPTKAQAQARKQTEAGAEPPSAPGPDAATTPDTATGTTAEPRAKTGPGPGAGSNDADKPPAQTDAPAATESAESAESAESTDEPTPTAAPTPTDEPLKRAEQPHADVESGPEAEVEAETKPAAAAPLAARVDRETRGHLGIRRVLAEARAYASAPPPLGRVRSSFAPGDARTLRADGPGWSMVARTDDIAFVLLDDEPGEVLPVGRGPQLPALLEALERLAVRPS